VSMHDYSTRRIVVDLHGAMKGRDWIEVLMTLVAGIFAVCFLVWVWPH